MLINFKTAGGGDNNVLVQQTAAFLLKSYSMETKQKESSSVSFFNDRDKLLHVTLSFSTWQDVLVMLDQVIDAFSCLCIRQIEFVRSKITSKSSWNENLLDIIAIAEFYYWRVLLSASLKNIRASRADYSSRLIDLLTHCLTLVALWRMDVFHKFFMAAKVFQEPQMLHVVQRESRLLAQLIRNDAAIMVDCFRVPCYFQC